VKEIRECCEAPYILRYLFGDQGHRIMVSQLAGIQSMLTNLVDYLSALVDYIASNKLAQLIIRIQALVVCVLLMFTGRVRTVHLSWQNRKRHDSSIYPPGMQFDVMQKQWARMGIDPPFPRGAPPT
jgi:hypothetical protein